jgi:hypothetical protein
MGVNVTKGNLIKSSLKNGRAVIGREGGARDDNEHYMDIIKP